MTGSSDEPLVLSAIAITLLEKAAFDNGFDLEIARDARWLSFGSTQVPLKVWLSTFTEALFVVGLSQMNVARALTEHGVPLSAPLPQTAVAGRSVSDVSALSRLLRRAFQLSATLPDELLHAFLKETASLPRATEVERLAIQRIGQDVFRAGLMRYWDGRCAITGLKQPVLLRASHIKPWADCESDGERLDVFNGFLLVAHLDIAFDQGLITVDDNGTITISERLDAHDRSVLGLDGEARIESLVDAHRTYLSWHRERIYIRT